MKVTMSKTEIPYYFITPFFEAAQKLVEDLAPTTFAVRIGSTLELTGEDEAEVEQFARHIAAMSPFHLTVIKEP